MEKNKILMVVIIMILAIMLAGVGFGFIYTINMIKSVQSPSEVEKPVAAQAYDVNSTVTIPLSNSIKANLLPENDGLEHLALVEMSIGVAGPVDATKKEIKANQKEIDALVASIQSREVIVRNLAIKLLRKSTYSELRRADGQDIYANMLLTELQNTFNSNFIVDVYFGDFFLQ